MCCDVLSGLVSCLSISDWADKQPGYLYLVGAFCMCAMEQQSAAHDRQPGYLDLAGACLPFVKHSA